MRWRSINVNPRTMTLAALTVTVVVTAWFCQTQLFPVYDEFRERKDLAARKAMELSRLRRNVASKDRIEREYASIGETVGQVESDSAALSEFLRMLETKARLPSMRIVNIKPLPVTTEQYVKTYGVRFAVAGKFQEVLMFMSALTEEAPGIGIDSFSLRGVQGGRRVECSATVRMVRFTSQSDDSAVPQRKRPRREVQ